MRAHTMAFMLAALLAAVPAAAAFAQGQSPRVSPPGQASVQIGAAMITIDYSRPSMRGRKVMGDLVPFGMTWRTGANEATHFKTESALQFGTVHVPAGTYTLYSLPGETEWKLIINKQTGQWGTKYDQAQDLARIDLKVEPTSAPVEQFTITLSATGSKTGLLVLEWEQTKLSVPFEVK